jgi:hypothetical protein
MKDKKLERIENEVIGLTMEIAGFIMGLGYWEKISDKGMTDWHNFLTDRRSIHLDKIRKIYLRKVKGV